jgi:class 3 adenylate cyclase
MHCSQCGQANPAQAKFCSECGNALVAGTSAQVARSPDSYTPRYLAERILRSRSALEGERKQVTVLFCDIVDSTPLAAALGSEGMHELLNEFFGVALNEVHHYEGTINQFLGDGFMALFGAPLAHEDHSRRAALAALGIRKQVEKRRAAHAAPGWRDVQVRMGLNSGFLVVGKIGNDLRMDYTAVGDTTNVAARIQGAARPGEILMSDSARRLSRGYIDVEALPPTLVKGKPEPIELHRVIGVGTRRSPIEMIESRRLTPFVGRTRDLAALGEALSRIRSGHGEVVDIEGEPGAGKSRLVHEFLGMLPHGVTHLVGRCVSYGGSIPYLPILDVLRQRCGIVETDEAEVVAKNCATCWRRRADGLRPMSPTSSISSGSRRARRRSRWSTPRRSRGGGSRSCGRRSSGRRGSDLSC